VKIKWSLDAAVYDNDDTTGRIQESMSVMLLMHLYFCEISFMQLGSADLSRAVYRRDMRVQEENLF